MAVAAAARAIPLALFSFNGGVELGQLLFVVVVLAGTAVLDLLPVRWLEAAALIPAYAMDRCPPIGFSRVLPWYSSIDVTSSSLQMDKASRCGYQPER